MNCTQAQHLLNSLMNGELCGENAREARFHLASCPECATKLTSSQWVEVMPALEEEVEPSGEFAQRFYWKLEERRMPWSKRILFWRWPRQLAAAGALMAVIAIGILVGRYPGAKRDNILPGNDSGIAEKLPILEDLAVINNLDLLEDFETIEDLTNLMSEDAAN